MTPAEIEALLAATTPGPWVLVDRGLNVTSPTANIAVTMGGVATAGEQQANAEWIAKSKEAAESLLAENARLRAVADAAVALAARDWFDEADFTEGLLVLNTAVDAYLVAEDA